MSTEDPGAGAPEVQPQTGESPPAAPQPPMTPTPPMAPPPVMNAPMAGGSPAPPAEGGWGTTPPSGAMMPPAKKSNSGMIIGIVVALVIALGAGGYFLTKGGGSSTKSVSLPEEIAGLPQMHDATADQLTQQFESSEFGGVKLKAGLYGEGIPGLIVMVTDEDPGIDAKEGFDGFLAGFTSTSAATVDQASRVDASRGGIDISCIGMSISGVPGTVCVWDDANVFGAVIDLRSDDSNAGLDTTEEVAQAVAT